MKVAVCEEGGHNSPTFGYFGILPSTWQAYDGARFAPLAGGAGWPQQVAVANQIVRAAHVPVPDQDGCNPNGW